MPMKPNLHRDRHVLASPSPPDHVLKGRQDGFRMMTREEQQNIHNFRQLLSAFSGRQIGKPNRYHPREQADK